MPQTDNPLRTRTPAEQTDNPLRAVRLGAAAYTDDHDDGLSPATPLPRTLRDYQVEAADAVLDQWDQGYERTSVVLPTGSGKSTVIAEVVRREVERGSRVVLLAHRGELLGQMADAVAAVDPEAEPVGIVMAEQDEPDAQVVAASFQTLARSPERIAALGYRDVILVDECHHAMADSYLRVLAALGLTLDKVVGDKKDADKDGDSEPEFGDHPAPKPRRKRLSRAEATVRHDGVPPVRACGFTATMSRSDSSRLGEVWNTVAYERDLVWAIDQGYLVAPRGKTVQIEGLDRLKEIKTVAGDYNQKGLDEVMRASVDTTVDAICRHARDRAMIVFAASVEHADLLADALTGAGVAAAAVVGSHSKDEREKSYAQFNAGLINALVTVMVLTEGADFPRCDCAIMARPTRSNVLFSQMVGRAVRLYRDPITGKDKTDALVLDLTGVARDTKLVTLTDLWGSATTQTFTENGDEVVEPDPEPMHGGPGRERRGRAEFTDVNLMGDPADPYRKVEVVYTTDGIVFIPSGRTGEGIMLWPPNPHEYQQVCILRLDPKQGISPWLVDDRTPAMGTFDEALLAAKQAAFHSVRDDGQPGYMEHKPHWARKRPSDRQKQFAQRLGITVTSAMMQSDLSRLITSTLVRRKVEKFYPQIQAWGLGLG